MQPWVKLRTYRSAYMESFGATTTTGTRHTRREVMSGENNQTLCEWNFIQDEAGRVLQGWSGPDSDQMRVQPQTPHVFCVPTCISTATSLPRPMTLLKEWKGTRRGPPTIPLSHRTRTPKACVLLGLSRVSFCGPSYFLVLLQMDLIFLSSPLGLLPVSFFVKYGEWVCSLSNLSCVQESKKNITHLGDVCNFARLSPEMNCWSPLPPTPIPPFPRLFGISTLFTLSLAEWKISLRPPET